jgi:hypothetical protein
MGYQHLQNAVKAIALTDAAGRRHHPQPICGRGALRVVGQRDRNVKQTATQIAEQVTRRLKASGTSPATDTPR